MNAVLAQSCPRCAARVEPDGVCLACLFNEALAVEGEMPTSTGETEAGRTFARLGPLELPVEVAGHRLLREIAAGGMGVVYEAEDLRLKRLVALKMIRGAAFARPGEMLRFRAEAAALAKLDHPYIVPVYDVGEVDGEPFFTMGLVRGPSLAKRLESGQPPLTATETVRLMSRVARAVQHAHERGVLHRDLKPGNILLDAQGEPHLTDFGLAKLLDDDAMLTRTMAQLGTPHYMSPEQAAGRTREVTTASDVWALGVLLYQLLTLKLPFNGESSIEVMQRVTDAAPATLDLRGVNPDLATLIRRCLEKEPAKRPPGAGFLADELERWLKGEPILSRPVGSLENAWRWVRRHRAVAAAIALTALALVVGSGVALWQRTQAIAARDLAQRQLREAVGLTDLFVDMLRVFDEKRSGPVTTKDEFVQEFLKRVEAYDGDPERRIELLTRTGSLLGRAVIHECHVKALAIARRSFPADDPRIWKLRWHAAIAEPLETKGEGHELLAIPELRRVYEWHRDHLGPGHPDTLRTAHSLARYLTFVGGHVEALDLLEQVKTFQDQHPRNPPVARLAFNTAYMNALFQNGRREDALQVGRESCRQGLANVTSDTSHALGRACHGLAKKCLEAGLVPEAIQHTRAALEIYWRFAGPAGAGPTEAHDLLVRLQRQHGDHDGLLATERDTLRAFDMALGPSRVESQRQLANYARELAWRGRKAEANALFEQWLARLRDSRGNLAPQAGELVKLHQRHIETTR